MLYLKNHLMKNPIRFPNFDNTELNNLAHTFIFAATGLIVISILFISAAPFFAPLIFPRALALVGAVIPLSIGIIVLSFRQKIKLAGAIFIFLLWLIISIEAIIDGGVSAPSFIGYSLVIIFAGMLSRRNAIWVTIACILSGFLMAYLEHNNLLPETISYHPYARVSVYIFFFLGIMILQYVNLSNLQALAQRSRNDEFRYRSLLENIPTTTYINAADELASTTYVSPQVEKLLGYPRQVFMEDPVFWTKIIHADDRERVLEESNQTNKTGQSFEMVYRLIAKNERTVWVKDTATLVYDDHGAPLYWIGIWTDVTDQKQIAMEQADLINGMTKRTIQLQTAAEVSRAATSILDIDKLLPTVAELIRNHFNYYYVGIFLKGENNEWAVLRAASGAQGKQLVDSGHRLKLGDSSMIGWCITNRQARIALDVGEDAVRFANPHLPLTRSEIALPLITHQNVIGAVSIQSEKPSAFSSVDITALQAMADLVANAIENARLYTERVTLTNELEAQNEELERFSYTVSHDLRSPLVTIRGFLGYLRMDAESGDIVRFDKDMHRIAKAVDKMQALLNELLELSRVGRIANPPENIQFGKIVQETLDLLSGQLEAKNIQVKVADEFPIIYADKIRVFEIIQNLVSNAIKFMGNQRSPMIEIGINGNDTDGKPIFYVRDNGIGIDPDYHARIFGLFNRLDPSIDGTGIGLTLIKRIVDIHGGRIWVESEPGKGATFCFTLPTQSTAK